MDEGDRAVRTSKLGSLVVRGEHEGDVHIIELIGELDLDGAPRLEEELRAAEAGDGPRSSSTSVSWSSSTRPGCVCW